MTTTTPRGPGCRRGDVALVVFPDSNLRTAKLRPVLVVQADDLGTGLSQVIVAMITSNLSRAGHASRVKVLRAAAEGRQSGLLTDSVVMTDGEHAEDQPALPERHGAASFCTSRSTAAALRHETGAGKSSLPSPSRLHRGREDRTPDPDHRPPGPVQRAPDRVHVVPGREQGVPGRGRRVPDPEQGFPGRGRRVLDPEQGVPGPVRPVPDPGDVARAPVHRVPDRVRVARGLVDRVPDRGTSHASDAS